MPAENAKKYMAEWAGIEFDPAVVKAFLAIKIPVNVNSEARSFSSV